MRFRHAVLGFLAVGCGLSVHNSAQATLTLTAAGTSLGFSLSTYYNDPTAYYGGLGVTTTATGNVVMTGYARDELYLLPDADGQSYATITGKVSLAGYGSAYSVATAGGATYFAPGFGGTYYSVNTSTLALTPLSLSTAVTPYLGLWANPVTGHLISSSYSGLVDIDPVTGSVHVITSTAGFDGVTVSPDGKTAYGELNGNIYAYDIVTGTLVDAYSGNGHSPDGTGVIGGGALNGDIVVNNNDGTVGLIDAGTGLETVIATGGTRGDFVGPDLTNGSLFLASADQVERLALAGASIGGGPPPVSAPEPGSLALLAVGVAGWMAARKQRG
jgi:hypothetical protein